MHVFKNTESFLIKIQQYFNYWWLIAETLECNLENFCELYDLRNLVRQPTCFKNPQNPSYIKLTKPRNDLKPPQTSHIIVFLLLKASYFQVAYVLIRNPRVFFGQIWCQKLKFSKLTEISFRGWLLYPYLKFKVYFFKLFVSHNF